MLGGKFHSSALSTNRDSKSDSEKDRSELSAKYWVSRGMLILDFGMGTLKSLHWTLGIYTKCPCNACKSFLGIVRCEEWSA